MILEFLKMFFYMIACVAYASLFEWMLHRFVMHYPILGFRYAYRAHAMVHHNIFKANHTYHLQKENDKRTIPMAWWNGPILISIASSPSILIRIWFDVWWPTITLAAVFTCYYATYEYIHWCMHLPRPRRWQMKTVWLRNMFIKLNGHHLLHHKNPFNNLNVVLPLWNWILGTLIIRNKKAFVQAVDPLVPDVQP